MTGPIQCEGGTSIWFLGRRIVQARVLCPDGRVRATTRALPSGHAVVTFHPSRAASPVRTSGLLLWDGGTSVVRWEPTKHAVVLGRHCHCGRCDSE